MNDELERRVAEAFANTPAQIFEIADRIAERNRVPHSFDEIETVADVLRADLGASKAERTIQALITVIEDSGSSDDLVTAFLDICVIMTEAGYVPPISEEHE